MKPYIATIPDDWNKTYEQYCKTPPKVAQPVVTQKAREQVTSPNNHVSPSEANKKSLSEWYDEMGLPHRWGEKSPSVKKAEKEIPYLSEDPKIKREAKSIYDHVIMHDPTNGWAPTPQEIQRDITEQSVVKPPTDTVLKSEKITNADQIQLSLQEAINNFKKRHDGSETAKYPSQGLADKAPELKNSNAQLDKSIIDAFNQISDKISHLDEKISNNLNASNKTAPVSFMFTTDDLKEFEKVLDELDNFKIKPTKINENVKPYTGREEIMAKSKQGWVTTPDGTQKHYTAEGVLHNDNGPAEIRLNGTKLYYRQGNLHREGGFPAMEAIRGTVKYAVNGKYHRLGGLPAITWSKGPYRHEYWVNGEIKSAQRKDGTREWYAPGCNERDEAILHRTDGPAVIHHDGREEYWINGTQHTYNAWLRNLELMEESKTLIQETLENELIDEDPVDEVYMEAAEKQEVAKKPSRAKKILQQEVEKKMSKEISFTDKLKADMANAGYRVAATQSTTIVKNAILTVMKNKGADGGAIQGISAFLDTEFGAALISFALGSGLHYVPHFNEDPRVQKLGEEMRVNGMATAGNAIIGEAMQHVLPALTQVLQNLPAVEEKENNVRVIESTSTDSKLVEAIEEEDEENSVVTTTTNAKTMKA